MSFDESTKHHEAVLLKKKKVTFESGQASKTNCQLTRNTEDRNELDSSDVHAEITWLKHMIFFLIFLRKRYSHFGRQCGSFLQTEHIFTIGSGGRAVGIYPAEAENTSTQKMRSACQGTCPSRHSTTVRAQWASRIPSPRCWLRLGA